MRGARGHLALRHPQIGGAQVRIGPAGDQVPLQQVPNLPFELVRQPGVVGIEERHQRRGGLGHAPIARRRRAAVRLPHATKSGTLDALRGVVRRAIVDDDHLGRLDRLLADRIQTAPYGRRGVVGRNHHGYPRKVGSRRFGREPATARHAGLPRSFSRTARQSSRRYSKSPRRGARQSRIAPPPVRR